MKVSTYHMIAIRVRWHVLIGNYVLLINIEPFPNTANPIGQRHDILDTHIYLAKSTCCRIILHKAVVIFGARHLEQGGISPMYDSERYLFTNIVVETYNHQKCLPGPLLHPFIAKVDVLTSINYLWEKRVLNSLFQGLMVEFCRCISLCLLNPSSVCLLSIMMSDQLSDRVD